VAALSVLPATAGSVERPDRPPVRCVYLPAERIVAVTVKLTPFADTLAGGLPPGLRNGIDRDFEGQAYVVRVGDRIRVLGGPDAEAVECTGGVPTVTNTDSVLVRRAAGVRDAELAVDMRRGLLVPGATDERDRTSEVEVFADLGRRGRVVVSGTSDPDHLAVGRLNAQNAVNFNASESYPDADVLTGPSRVVVYGGAGGDLLDAANPPGMSTVSAKKRGWGPLLIGGGGPDILVGTPADDYLQGDAGADLLSSGDGSDILFGLDGRRDRVDCGPGRDTFVVVDRLDSTNGCEEEEFTDPFAE
jgi:hypothetical protein